MTKKRSKLLYKIRKRRLFGSLFCSLFESKYLKLDEKTKNKKGRLVLNYRFDCSRPRTFNEYTTWLILHYRNDLWKICADKLASKQFLIDHGFGKYVVDVLKVYESVLDINLDELPTKFVLKTNHDSGTVFICEKGKTDFEKVFKKLKKSMKNNYGNKGEWVYSNIKPTIFAEKYLEPKEGPWLVDYKMFGYNGHFCWGFAAQERNVDTRISVFDKDFNIQDTDYIYLRPKKSRLPRKPGSFDEMRRICEDLSKILDYVRVDFYESTEGVKIGELTFFSMGGFGAFTKKEYDFKYGEFFKYTKLYKMIPKGEGND